MSNSYNQFEKNSSKSKTDSHKIEERSSNEKLVKSLNENIDKFKTIFQKDNTIVYREIKNIHNNSFSGCLIYVEGMIDKSITNKNIITPILNSYLKDESYCDLLDNIKNKVLSTSKVEKSGDFNKILLDLFYGDAILLVDGFDEALLINSKGWITRSLSEPAMEKALRGPREGFIEPLIINLSLIRRRLKTPDLKFEFKEIGVRTRTSICVCYIDNLVNDKILKELENRLDKIEIDGLVDSGYVEELIKDSPYSPYKTIGNTERPDVVVAKLLEGRIAIVVDGSPSVLTLPYVFMEYFQVAEDYYNNFFFSSINRIIRFSGEFFSMSIPSIYVSLITYHQEMIPTPMLLSISSARQGVPFPTIVEAIVLLFAFEIIREAAVRMPSPMGQSVSIVGALILGQAAVQARIFSAPMVIVVALTGITGLLNLKLKGATIIVRLILLLLGAFIGLYGYIFGVIGLLIYLFSMRSFGVPYMLEYGSINSVDLKDTFIRAPWWHMTFRPKQLAAKNIIRNKSNNSKGN